MLEILSNEDFSIGGKILNFDDINRVDKLYLERIDVTY